MKLIIDIDDEMVCNDIKNKALEPTSETDKVIINALYNGTPVSNEGDLISREALKKALEDYEAYSDIIPKQVYDFIDNAPTVKPDISEIEEKFWHRCGFLQGYTTRLNDVRPQGKWVPVSERLPEKMGTYLVTLEYKEHGAGITTLWYHGKGIGWDLRVADVVTAWQSLPEPYKEGGEEE